MFPFGIVAKHMRRMLSLELGNGTEAHVIPEFLSVSSVRSFDLPILRGFTRVNEKMDNVFRVARAIKYVEARMERINALLVSRIVVREN